ncbi:MAG: hypothetical protein WC389_22835 [Lutibacter sp.]
MSLTKKAINDPLAEESPTEVLQGMVQKEWPQAKAHVSLSNLRSA